MMRQEFLLGQPANDLPSIHIALILVYSVRVAVPKGTLSYDDNSKNNDANDNEKKNNINDNPNNNI